MREMKSYIINFHEGLFQRKKDENYDNEIFDKQTTLMKGSLGNTYWKVRALIQFMNEST